MIKLYDTKVSGNCYKVRLFLSVLSLKHELVSIDLKGCEHKSPEFQSLNPLSQVPVLVDGDVTIHDSQAILTYLARRYGGDSWFPNDPQSLARVVQWLSIAANELEHGPYAARLANDLKLPIDLPPAQERAHEILSVMEGHLAERTWLELECPTIADIACYPAIALAPRGDISLDLYPSVKAWLKRVTQLRGYKPMPGIAR